MNIQNPDAALHPYLLGLTNEGASEVVLFKLVFVYLVFLYIFFRFCRIRSTCHSLTDPFSQPITLLV